MTGLAILRFWLALSVTANPDPGASSRTSPGLRWPRWPTELAQAEATLRAPKSPVAARHVALRQLDPYATPVVEPLLLLATRDAADDVRQAAFERCLRRELDACVPEARKAWKSHGVLLLRMSALKVIARRPRGDDTQLVFNALGDPDDSMRGHAAQLIGRAEWEAKTLPAARRALMTKLSDPSATVRKLAVESLGQLGPSEGCLALVRLLDDADPVVREAAARALDRCREARFLPALARTLARGGSSHLMVNVLRGITNLPTPAADSVLLAALDQPPATLRRREVAELLALRANPTRAFIDQLIDRTRDEGLRADVLDILVGLGPAVVEPLEAARRQGLAPAIDAQFAGIIATHRRHPSGWQPAPAPVPTSVPDWILSLGDTAPSRRNATLDALDPTAGPWLWGHAVLSARQGFAASITAPLLMGVLRHPPSPREVSAPQLGTMLGYFVQAPADRGCLALLVFAAAGGEAIVEASGDPHVPRRRCAAIAAGVGDHPPLVAAALADPSPTVRAAAAYATALLPRLDPAILAKLHLLAVADEHGAVRSNARFSAERARIESSEPPRWTVEWHDPPIQNRRRRRSRPTRIPRPVIEPKCRCSKPRSARGGSSYGDDHPVIARLHRRIARFVHGMRPYGSRYSHVVSKLSCLDRRVGPLRSHCL
ncbi:MAG: hypothetical protein B7733_08275 [Myxococcales bacterium FL481]|nr:MAG: hypothetical protein B7733_08275 [Myxococcales bacterium FL481]